MTARKLLWVYLVVLVPVLVLVGGFVTSAATYGLYISFKRSALQQGPMVGWYTPQPPYPYEARAGHISGSGVISLKTNHAGRISDAHMNPSTGSHLLDTNTVDFATDRWSGPPDAFRKVPITYQLQ